MQTVKESMTVDRLTRSGRSRPKHGAAQASQQ